MSFARKGGTLTMAQLLKVLYNMKTAERVKAFLKGDVPDLPVLMAIAELIAEHRDLSAEIDRCILSEDEMADNASPQLRSIRRTIIRQNEALKAKINHILNSSDNKTILQDAIVTMRNGRYVIPVKQEHKARVPGIVHDQSGSGATLFIEPQAVVNLNNELRQLELDEKAEINRILTDLSERTAEHYHDLKNNQVLLTKLDLFMAKGRLSIDMGADEPEIDQDGILDLKRARHPLIDRKKVVPVNIALGDGYETLVITGPNTGGKTVTLKTAGLLSLMAQAGLHIPADPGKQSACVLIIFAPILAIDQSIEQSVSTFSSHMKTIVTIVEEAGPHGLTLLGRAAGSRNRSDRRSGAGDRGFRKSSFRGGVFHCYNALYGIKKICDLEQEGVPKRLPVESDVETLSPTYRLNIRDPGQIQCI